MSDESSHDSVARWIAKLKEGDEQAAQRLWERYYEKLVQYARKRMSGLPRRVADEEDMAIRAFDSFYRGVSNGRFPQLEDHNDLWQILVMITARKVINERNYHRRQKRGGGKVRGESVFASAGRGIENRQLEQIVGDEPAPEFAAEVAESLQQLLEQLDDALLRQTAIAKMEGYSNHEISERLGCSLRSVERKLKTIRSIWSRTLET